MLAARDNKHNIVEKLLELGAVVTDKDKVGGEIRSTCTSLVNTTRFFRAIFFNYTRIVIKRLICHFVSFTASNKVTLLGHSLISGDFTENILETLKDVELVIFPL